MSIQGVGIIGAGVVGQGVLELLESQQARLSEVSAPYEVLGVAVRDASKARPGLRAKIVPVEALLADPRLSVLVEVAGGIEAPFGWVSQALNAGKAVVTANKAMLAERAEPLHALLAASGGRMYCEAAVAGGIPILSALDRGLVANRIVRVQGILNGTCNYLLTLMEREGLGFEAALSRAQALGFAEADPTLDVSGGDAAHKLAVLATLVLGVPVPFARVAVEGIERITAFDLEWAAAHGFRIKLLAHGRFDPGEVELRVHPTLVPRSRLISEVMEEFNAVELEGDLTGPQLYQGRGAGRYPTASAVVADIVQALRGEPMLRARPKSTKPPRFVPLGEVVSRHYVHLEVIDQPGVVARVATALAKTGISIASMFQPDVAHGSQVPLVFTTHPAKDAAMKEVLQAFGTALAKESFLVKAPVHIRIEGA